jgi:hypothetical protein
MSGADLALEGKLRAVRLAVGGLPKHLRPVPTCATMQEAAASLGMSVTRLKLTLRGKRLRVTRVGGVPHVPLAVLDSLRR